MSDLQRQAPRFANAKEVAGFLGFEQPVLNCLRWRFLLKYPTPRHLAYDADDMLECRDFLDDLMTPEEVDQIVGVPRDFSHAGEKPVDRDLVSDGEEA